MNEPFIHNSPHHPGKKSIALAFTGAMEMNGLSKRPCKPQVVCPQLRWEGKGLSPLSASRDDQALADPPVELAVERVVELAEATMLPLPRIVTL